MGVVILHSSVHASVYVFCCQLEQNVLKAGLCL